MLSLQAQREQERIHAEHTGIPVERIAVDMEGVVRAFLLNMRLNGFRVDIVEEWVEIDPFTFRDLKGE